MLSGDTPTTAKRRKEMEPEEKPIHTFQEIEPRATRGFVVPVSFLVKSCRRTNHRLRLQQVSRNVSPNVGDSHRKRVRVNRAGLLVCLLSLLVIGCESSGRRAATTEPFPSATPQAVVSVTKAIFPAVVRLDVAQEMYSQGKRTVQRGIGSGVIIDQKGHVLTNYHVAGRASEIYVTLENKERVPAKLIGDDHWTDLAIVQMDMDT